MSGTEREPSWTVVQGLSQIQFSIGGDIPIFKFQFVSNLRMVMGNRHLMDGQDIRTREERGQGEDGQT
jgi:hypothetical protein